MRGDDRTRPERVADWIGWHLAELAAVGIPSGLAATGSPWWWLAAGVAGAAWAAAEARTGRRSARTALPPPEQPAALPASGRGKQLVVDDRQDEELRA